MYVEAEMEALARDCPTVGAQYELLGRIGEGTFSAVYKARSLARSSEIVALKHLYLNSAPHRIENEATFLDELGCGQQARRARAERDCAHSRGRGRMRGEREASRRRRQRAALCRPHAGWPEASGHGRARA